MFHAFARACGSNLARAHSKSGAPRAIGDYLGKNDEFDEAIAAFAVAYADQTERDHAALKDAVKSGKTEVYLE
jgi:NAD(P)H-dependent flavin oxidoreductase YrpB (nitropropane dioxygenase family)